MGGRPVATCQAGNRLREIVVSRPNKPTAYQALVRQTRAKVRAEKNSEEQLDGLIALHEKRRSQEEAAPEPAKPSPIELLRAQMSGELIQVFENLRTKYEPSGIFIEMDAQNLLSGGVGVVIDVEYDIYAMRMEGTATDEGIAFQETRFSNNVRGVVTAGPMLRSRNLTGQQFRNFVCERITQLIRSAMRRR